MVGPADYLSAVGAPAFAFKIEIAGFNETVIVRKLLTLADVPQSDKIAITGKPHIPLARMIAVPRGRQIVKIHPVRYIKTLGAFNAEASNTGLNVG